jgi:hypothetical protein
MSTNSTDYTPVKNILDKRVNFHRGLEKISTSEGPKAHGDVSTSHPTTHDLILSITREKER